MEGFTLVDGGVAALIILSALLAWSRGFAREALSIGAWILAAVVGFMFAGQAAPLLANVPILSDLLAGSCELSLIAGFSVVFALTLIVMSIITPLVSSTIQDSALGGVDRGLGFIFGAARGLLLVAVALFLYQYLGAGTEIAIIDQSRSVDVFNGLVSSIEQQGPDQALGWITNRYEALVISCEQA